MENENILAEAVTVEKGGEASLRQNHILPLFAYSHFLCNYLVPKTDITS